MATLSNGRELYNHSKWRAIPVCLRTRALISTSPEPKTDEALHDRASFLRFAFIVLSASLDAVAARPGEAPM